MKRKQVAIIISVIAFVLVLVGVVGFVFYTVSDKGRNSAPLPSFVTEEKWWVVLAAEIARDSEKPSKKEPADKMGPYEKIEYGMGIDKENFWYQPSSFGEEFLNVNGNEYETGTHLRLVDRDIAVEGDNVVFSYYTDSGNYYINLNGKKIGPFDSEHALSKEIVDASEQHVGFSFIHKDRVGFVVDEKLYGPFHGVCINTTSSTEIKPEYNCTGMDYYTTAFQIEGNNWGFYYPENAEEFNRRVREEKLDTPSTSIQDWYVVLNGEKYGPFASRPELFVTEEKTAFVGDGSLWVDGEKKSDFGSSYDLGLVKDGLVTSIYEDSETNKKKYVRINDKSYGPFDAVESLSFTIKDGKWGFSFLRDGKEYSLINGIEYGPFTNIGDNKLIFFDQYFAIPHYRFDGQKNVERLSYYLEIGDEVFGPFADDESESGDILELYSGKFLNQIVDGKRYWFSETGLFYGPFEDSNLSIEKQMDYISEEEQKKTFLLEESNHMYYFYHRAERKGPYYEAFLEINDGLYQLVYREYKNNEDGYQYPADWWVEIESL